MAQTRNVGTQLTAEATPANPKKGAYGGQVDILDEECVGGWRQTSSRSSASSSERREDCQIGKSAHAARHLPQLQAGWKSPNHLYWINYEIFGQPGDNGKPSAAAAAIVNT